MMDLTTRLPFAQNLVVALIGICVVFSILLFLFIVLKLFGVIFEPRKAKTAATATPELPEETVQTAEAEKCVVQDDSELVAVITAAIASSIGRSASEIRVVSFRRK